MLTSLVLFSTVGLRATCLLDGYDFCCVFDFVYKILPVWIRHEMPMYIVPSMPISNSICFSRDFRLENLCMYRDSWTAIGRATLVETVIGASAGDFCVKSGLVPHGGSKYVRSELSGSIGDLAISMRACIIK